MLTLALMNVFGHCITECFFNVHERFLSLLKNYLCHVNFLYNLVTRPYGTVIFRISNLYVRSLDLCACSKLGLYFVHILVIYRKFYSKK